MQSLFRSTKRYASGGPTRRCSGRRFASIKIGAILKAKIGSTAFSIYDGGAAERQAVGPPPSLPLPTIRPFHVLQLILVAK
jgi:hypothetical protein